jgi:hypothetical protein
MIREQEQTEATIRIVFDTADLEEVQDTLNKILYRVEWLSHVEDVEITDGPDLVKD